MRSSDWSSDVCSSDLRRRQRVRDHAEERRLGASDGDQVALGGQMARVETREFTRAFAKLTSEERALLMMATVEELPYETIAQMLEVEIGTVKSRVSRVRAKLRRLQEEEGDVALARYALASAQVRQFTGIEIGRASCRERVCHDVSIM